MMANLPILRKGSGVSVSEQITAHFAALIRAGRLRAGERLPPIRTIAEEIEVTRATVQSAYRRLAKLGLVNGTVGRGTSVLAGKSSEPETSGGIALSPAAHAALQRMQAPLPSAQSGEDEDLVANFAPLAPDDALFPVREFKRSLERALEQRGSDLLSYGPPGGDPELRSLLCAREHAKDPNEILITSGAQQGLDLVLRTFCAPGEAALVPSPTYHHLISLLRVQGVHVLPVRCDERGVDLEELARLLPKARLCYVMPTFHNPTGRTLDATQRAQLMEIIGKTRVPVLEDEFQKELRVRGEAPPSLRALDRRGLTITVRTFSKGLFPGVRIGWLVARPDLLAPIAALKRLTDLETSSLLQAALADFLARGLFDRYLEQLKDQLQKRHTAAQQALAQHMPDQVKWTSPDGGYTLWLQLPEKVSPERYLELAKSRGVLVTPGRVFDPLDHPVAAFRLSLSRTAPRQIEAGVRVLAECARECLSAARPSDAPLFL